MSSDEKLLHGRKPGDRRVRVERPDSRYFRYARPGVVVARPAASEPRTRLGRTAFTARRALFGQPIASAEEIEQRLPKWKALAVFSSDVMSSVAYATEASMFTLLAAGTVAFAYLMPISFLIVGLLVPRDLLLPPDDPGLSRAAAAATSSPTRTSGRCPGSWPPRPC